MTVRNPVTTSEEMPELPHPIYQVLREDTRYKLEAYEFVRDALSYAQEVMGLGGSDTAEDEESPTVERHLTGQQLCEASRRYALDQYGLLAKTVLKSWGIHGTADLGEVVYNLIRIDMMKKSERDRREDFDEVFDFDQGFDQSFGFSSPGEIEL